MPALKVFRRRWYLGSDDLVYSSLLELTIRILWLVALMAVYFLQLDQNTCSDGYKIKLFYVGTMIFLAIYTAINVAIATTSAHGSIMDVHPRRHVVTLLYIKFAVFIPEVVWAILATWWIFNLAVDCGPVTILLAKAAVITEWIIIVCLLTSVYLMFDPLGRRPLKKRSLKDYKKMWRRRCRFMCCCLHHDENRADAFEEVATLLTLFFHGRDLVLTDILAGVILLSAKQRYDRQMNFNPIMDVSEADTLRIRRCYRLDYQGISITEKDGHHINTNNIHTDIGIDPGQNNVGISDSRKDHHSGNDSGADIQTESRTFSENSVNAGQESRFYVESEKTRLYDRKDRHVPDYGTSASEDRTQFRQTESVPHLVRGGSVVSTTDSWMSNESELCPGFTPPRGPQKWMTLENAAYYLRYATAIYGSSNYAGCYNCSDRIPLCRKYRWCKNDPYLPPDVLQGDNYWECEAASVMLYSHLDRKDIIYADLDNQVFKTPYFVCRDDNKKVIVIAIRGTMSAGDALTDLTAQGEDIKVEHLPRGNVHKGIQNVAKKIKNQLENDIQLKNKIPQGYSLVLTGHSLGAGVAAVLSLLIRDQYPDVICFAFSPPGGLVSLSLSIYLQEFVLSCFLGMDVVARLGVINMEKLKKDLLAVIKNSRLPKYKILSSGLLSMCCGCLPVSDDALLDDTQTIKLSGSVNSDWEHVTWTGDKDSLAMFDGETEETDYLSRQSSVKTMEPSGGFKDGKGALSQQSFTSYDSSCSSSSRYSKANSKHNRDNDDPELAISDSHAKWRRKQKNKKVGLAATDPLYLPGQILYLYEDEELTTETCCHTETVYKARWARTEEFNSIQLHSKMMYHHNPYTVDEAIQQILGQRQYCTQSPTDSDPVRSQYVHNLSARRSFDSGIPCDGLVEVTEVEKSDRLNIGAECVPTKADTTRTNVSRQSSSEDKITEPSDPGNGEKDVISSAEEMSKNLTSGREEEPTDYGQPSQISDNTSAGWKELETDIQTQFYEGMATYDNMIHSREDEVDGEETEEVKSVHSRESDEEVNLVMENQCLFDVTNEGEGQLEVAASECPKSATVGESSEIRKEDGQKGDEREGERSSTVEILKNVVPIEDKPPEDKSRTLEVAYPGLSDPNVSVGKTPDSQPDFENRSLTVLNDGTATNDGHLVQDMDGEVDQVDCSPNTDQPMTSDGRHFPATTPHRDTDHLDPDADDDELIYFTI